ncbi:MAG: putative metal-dependent hydrolase [Gemmatimonadota bacterium]
MTDPRYPIGAFEPVGRPLSEQERNTRIDTIAMHPERVRERVEGLDDDRLDTPYRSGGWTLRQLTHHLADSHMNAYIRFRLALTEEQPTIQPYDQDGWARLTDAERAPVEPSLRILDGLHERWATLLRALDHDDFQKLMRHPEIGDVSLDFMLDLYAWHCAHHEAHLGTGSMVT